MTAFVGIFSFVFGTLLGSFCNVVIYRLHAGDSPTRGRSYCPHCHHTLSAVDLIPLLSFLALRGKCRYCSKLISWQYPLVEMAMGIATALSVYAFGLSVTSALAVVLAGFLLIIFVYDLRYQLILDRVSVPAMAVAVVFSLVVHRSFLSILLGGILGAGIFYVQYVLSQGRWIGGGDIRLGAVLGLALGWQLAAVALALSYFSGALVAIVLILGRRRSWSSVVPFGTFLSLGTFVTMLWGDAILQWYLHGGFFLWFVDSALRFYHPNV